jgi:Plasma-membrane choline transporter
VALAYLMLALAFGWTMLWFLGVGESLQSSNLGVVFLLFLSYYWVHQVLQNTMQVTTAGVVGTWWFVTEEANSCCSKAIGDSFWRASTYSFGSICLGSFLVALVQALRALEYHTRDNDDFQFLSCIIQCLLSCLQSILEEINKWAYVYVGLYGFGFLEAGRNVITLFESKGWSVIITDDLAENVLFMMSLAIAMGSGLVGLAFGLLDPYMLANIIGSEDGNAALAGFLIGALVGLLFSTVVLSVVGSAVNTVIVCFCEAPRELEQNHPQLSAEMRASWTQAWPELF